MNFSQEIKLKVTSQCNRSFLFADILMLMASEVEMEPKREVITEEDDTPTPSNKSQADSLSGSTSGLEFESSFNLAPKSQRSPTSGHTTIRSPVLSPPSDRQTGQIESLCGDQHSWEGRVSETVTSSSGEFYVTGKLHWPGHIQILDTCKCCYQLFKAFMAFHFAGCLCMIQEGRSEEHELRGWLGYMYKDLQIGNSK